MVKKTESPVEASAAVFVLFCGGGDLAWRKVVPALFSLFRSGSLPEKFCLLAVDRVAMSNAQLCLRLREGAGKFLRGQIKPAEWGKFAAKIRYQQGDFKQLATYKALGVECGKVEKAWGEKAQRIFYMATPPSMFPEIPKHLGESGLAADRTRARIVVEKPIGYDLESALSLNAILGAHFQESQIYRIDHYLGKETVQNILAFRFANPIFEPIWNRRYVDYVTITVAETVGIGAGTMIMPAPCATWYRTI